MGKGLKRILSRTYAGPFGHMIWIGRNYSIGDLRRDVRNQIMVDWMTETLGRLRHKNGKGVQD